VKIRIIKTKETKSWFFEKGKINDKPLGRLSNKKEERHNY
jgi:hypothetical protein